MTLVTSCIIDSHLLNIVKVDEPNREGSLNAIQSAHIGDSFAPLIHLSHCKPQVPYDFIRWLRRVSLRVFVPFWICVSIFWLQAAGQQHIIPFSAGLARQVALGLLPTP